MTIAGRQTAPHAARLIGSGLSRRPAEDSAAQLRGVCTPGRIRTRVLLQLESNTTCSRDLHGNKSACMQANKEGVHVHLHASKLQIAKALARVHARMHLPIKHANICVYISPRSGLHQATSRLRMFVGSEFCTDNVVRPTTPLRHATTLLGHLYIKEPRSIASMTRLNTATTTIFSYLICLTLTR